MGSEHGKAGYRRSAGTPRGEARRLDLLEKVTDDLAVNGLVDFSLRRAARVAGTTHKVLLYHFASVDDLMLQAILRLRGRRIERGLLVASREPTLASRVRAIWPILSGADARVLEQAIGLAMYDPDRYSALAREASAQYLPSLLSLCPAHWSERRKLEVSEVILAALRGFLVDWRTSGDADGCAVRPVPAAATAAADPAPADRVRLADQARRHRDRSLAAAGPHAGRHPPRLAEVIAGFVG